MDRLREAAKETIKVSIKKGNSDLTAMIVRQNYRERKKLK